MGLLTSGSSRPGRAGVALLAAVVLAGAACSSDDEDAGATSSTTNGTDATSTTTALPAPTAAAVIAHRGASAEAPEHTFAAYDLAVEQGADYLEQDLQMTADGVLVALHDDTLDRTARGPAGSCSGPVNTKTLEQLQACDVGTWFNEADPDRADPGFEGLRIPTMEEILDRYGDEVRYYIEIKSPGDDPGMEAAVLELLDDAGLTDDPSSEQVLIQSFSADSLRLLHDERPELPLVQLLPASPTPLDPGLLDAVAEYAVAVGPSFGNVDAAFVAAAHERCLDVHPYTVDDPVQMGRLLDLGVEGMFTNTPATLLQEREGRPDPAAHCEPAATSG